VFLLGNLPIEMHVDRLVTMDELMPDRLEKQLLERRNLPITALGIVKMRPDLTTNDDTAKKMLKRSSVTDIRTLAAVLPDLATATILVARFKAGGRRKKWHAHIFIPEASSIERVSFDVLRYGISLIRCIATAAGTARGKPHVALPHS
jgi:hypothetical protein